MPLYSFICDGNKGCMRYFEVTMSLLDLDKYDRGKGKIKCPACKKLLRKLIAPVRLSSARCTMKRG